MILPTSLLELEREASAVSVCWLVNAGCGHAVQHLELCLQGRASRIRYDGSAGSGWRDGRGGTAWRWWIGYLLSKLTCRPLSSSVPPTPRQSHVWALRGRVAKMSCRLSHRRSPSTEHEPLLPTKEGPGPAHKGTNPGTHRCLGSAPLPSLQPPQGCKCVGVPKLPPVFPPVYVRHLTASPSPRVWAHPSCMPTTISCPPRTARKPTNTCGVVASLQESVDVLTVLVRACSDELTTHQQQHV